MTTRQQMLAMTAAAALVAMPALALAQATTPGANTSATGGTLAQTSPGAATPGVTTPGVTTPGTTPGVAPGVAPGTTPGANPAARPGSAAGTGAAPTPMLPGTTANTAPGMAPANPGAARDGTAGNPPSTAAQRAADSITGDRTPADGTPGNPPGTAAGRAVDRTLGTNMTGANPAAPAAGAAPAAATTGPLAVDASTLKSGHRASKLIGSAVYNENNESIGEVDDVLIPAGGTGPVAVISVGGFLGIGAKLVAVPYNRLSMAANSNGRWTLAGATKDSLGSLPTFTYEAAAERRG